MFLIFRSFVLISRDKSDFIVKWSVAPLSRSVRVLFKDCKEPQVVHHLRMKKKL